MEPYPFKCALIEELLARSTTPGDNLAEEVIKDKLRFQKATLDQISGLIQEREKARQNNLASIESESVKIQSDLFLYKCIIYPISPDHKRKSNLERAISELENRRRQEQISCWKDTLKLWLQLLEVVAEHKATLRKAQILGIEK
jgi:hypothetical protein